MLGRAGRGLPEALDRRQRLGVVGIVPDGPDLMGDGDFRSEATAGGGIDPVVLGVRADEFDKHDRCGKLDRDHQR